MKSKYLISLLLLSILSLNIVFIEAVGTYPTLDPNMVLYYHFNNQSAYGENDTYVYDFSGNGKNGSVIGGAVHNNTGGFLQDGAFQFDGVDDYVNLSVNTWLNTTNNWTITGWVNFNNVTLPQAIFVNTINTNNRLAIFLQSGVLKAGIYNGASYIGVSSSSSTLVNYTWYYFTYIYSNGNGSLIINHINQTGALSPTTSSTVGSRIGALQTRINNLTGSIDDFIIYNRTLTYKEVFINYNDYLGIKECNEDFSNLDSNQNCTLYSGFPLIMNGTYNINVNGSGLGVIIPLGSNTYIDCNNSNFNGNGTFKFYYSSSKSNATIKNCNVNNYSSINFDSGNNFYFINNTLNTINLYIAKVINLTFYNNNINNCLSTSTSGCIQANDNNAYWNISNNYFGLTNYRHIYQPIGSSLNDSFISNNIFNTSQNDYSISMVRVTRNISFINDTFYNQYSNSLRIDNGYNNIFNGIYSNNNKIGEFHNGINNSFNNLFSYNYSGSGGFNVYLFNESSFLVNNSNLSLDNSTASISIEDSNNFNLTNNYIYFNKKFDSILITNSSNFIIFNNTIDKTDRGISIVDGSNNFYIYNNSINNSITAYDGYNIGIGLEYNVSNGILIGNNIINYGSEGYLIRQANNITILNYYCNQNTLQNRASQGVSSYLEPNSCIFISEIYKSYYGNGYSGLVNISNSQLYKSTNINISNGTFGNNVDVYLRNQGGVNVTHDLTGYTYRKFQIPNDWVDADEFYIRNDFDNLSIVNYTAVTDELGQDWMYGYNRVILYKIHKDYMKFYALQDIRDGTPSQDIINKKNNGYNFTIFNLSSPLISFSNGTSIYQSGTNLEYNLSLSPNQYLYVYENFGDLSRCNDTNNFTIINFTFVNEKNSSNKLNGTIQSANFNYYQSGLPVNASRNYNFTSSELNSSFPICTNQPSKNYYIDYTLIYSGDGYGERTKTTNQYILYQNQTNNIELSLLNSTNVITFQVINSFSQAINNAYVYVLPYLNDTVLMSGYTDSGGIIQFLMNNGTQYRVYFSKSGYDNYNTLLNPTENFYTITLSGLGVTVVTPPDYGNGDVTIPNSKGVTYRTYPINTWLNNGTEYNFTYTIDSGVWNLTNWGFNLTDQDSNLINATSSTNANGGTITINASSSNYSKVIMNFYYEVNETVINLQRVWTVLDLSDNQFSIKQGLDDATAYINSGLFGLTIQGLSFIVFAIIFIASGILSYRYGLTSPVAILGFIFAMVWLFDVSLNFIPNPIGAIPHFATVLIGIVFFSFIIKEVSSG